MDAATNPRQIKLIVIHCSASPNGRRRTSEEIDADHAARGFKRNLKLIGYNEPTLKHIGYHYVIYAEGCTRIGRGEQEIGAHVAGFNTRSIGVCMVGTDAFSRDQWATLGKLITDLLKRYPGARVCGHRDLSPDQNKNGIVEPFEWLKICPGFDVATWLQSGMKPLPAHVFEARR